MTESPFSAPWTVIRVRKGDPLPDPRGPFGPFICPGPISPDSLRRLVGDPLKDDED